MKVTFTITAEGTITAEIPDDRFTEFMTFVEDHEARGPLDPSDLPDFCGIDMADLPNQMKWEIDDIWWKDQGK